MKFLSFSFHHGVRSLAALAQSVGVYAGVSLSVECQVSYAGLCCSSSEVRKEYYGEQKVLLFVQVLVGVEGANERRGDQEDLCMTVTMDTCLGSKWEE